MIFATVITAQNALFAINLAKSIKVHEPESKFAICIVEEQIPKIIKKFNSNFIDYVFLAKDLELSHFYHHVFKHNNIEACCSMKPRTILHLMDKFPDNNKFVYLDSDIKVYSPLQVVSNLLNKYSIILTPHTIEPDETFSELRFYKFGVYNLGFIAVSRTDETMRFLKWWKNRVEMLCYIDLDKGLFVDQKWIDFAPVFFNDVHVLRDPGYNVAWWDICHRKMAESPNGEKTVNGLPLCFFHFSGVTRLGITKYGQLKDKNHRLFHSMLADYANELIALGYSDSNQHPWSYDYFISGEKITDCTRKIYRENPGILSKTIDPFTKSNTYFANRNNKSKNEEDSNLSTN